MLGKRKLNSRKIPLSNGVRFIPASESDVPSAYPKIHTDRQLTNTGSFHIHNDILLQDEKAIAIKGRFCINGASKIRGSVLYRFRHDVFLKVLPDFKTNEEQGSYLISPWIYDWSTVDEVRF